jgi:hypothetical protein
MTDGLSRFGVAERHEGSLTSEKLVSLVSQVKDVLYALNSEKSNVIGRTNRAHTSEKLKECLKKVRVVPRNCLAKLINTVDFRQDLNISEI